MERYSRTDLASFRRQRNGFTVVELLVSIAIVAILMALLLPAVQQARETARGVQCRNNLKQLALATELHEGAHGWYPTGGWGKDWVGLPEFGYGKEQPGGWIFNILPMIEQAAVRELGNGNKAAPDSAANARRLAMTIPLLNCPSRRNGLFTNTRQPHECDPVTTVARSDYAMNGGHRHISYGSGPATLLASGTFGWPNMSQNTGLTHIRSTIRKSKVTDGLSNTYLIGEKHLRFDRYDDGTDVGDNESLYSGDDRDIVRYTGDENDRTWRPLHDRFISSQEGLVFGSVHDGGFRVSLADGSVRIIGYSIDQTIHSRMGSCNDGQTTDLQ